MDLKRCTALLICLAFFFNYSYNISLVSAQEQYILPVATPSGSVSAMEADFQFFIDKRIPQALSEENRSRLPLTVNYKQLSKPEEKKTVNKTSETSIMTSDDKSQNNNVVYQSAGEYKMNEAQNTPPEISKFASTDLGSFFSNLINSILDIIREGNKSAGNVGGTFLPPGAERISGKKNETDSVKSSAAESQNVTGDDLDDLISVLGNNTKMDDKSQMNTIYPLKECAYLPMNDGCTRNRRPDWK